LEAEVIGVEVVDAIAASTSLIMNKLSKNAIMISKNMEACQ